MLKYTSEMLDERRALRDQFPTLPLAFSSGGPRAHLVGPLGGGAGAGPPGRGRSGRRPASAQQAPDFDTNSDHVYLGEVRPDVAGEPDAEAYRSIGADVMVARARGCGGNQLLAIHYSDLEIAGQTLLLGLDPTHDLEDYAAFRMAVGSLSLPYAVRDVIAAATALDTPAGRHLATRIENIGLADWGLWCQPGEVSMVDSAPLDQPCTVFDLGSLDSAAERILVASAALRWLWRLLASQRPSKVHANVVSQCDNLALLRVNSVADVDDLCRIFSHVPLDLIRQAPGFSLGEVLFAGPIAHVPLQVSVGRRLSPEGGGDVPTDWADQ